MCQFPNILPSMPSIRKPKQCELYALNVDTLEISRVVGIKAAKFLRIAQNGKLLKFRFYIDTLEPYSIDKIRRRHNRINIRLFRYEVELRGYLLKIEKQNAALKALVQ